MASPHDDGAPARAPRNADTTDSNIVGADLLADLDALAESLRGYLVLQLVVDDAGHKRTSVYRSAASAQRAVRRARDRGRATHVTLVQMVPLGVVVGLGGAQSSRRAAR
jgi:hypothetical protein